MSSGPILYFDTETNGVGTFRPAKQALMQLGYVMGDTQRSILVAGATSVKPGLPHDLTPEKCRAEGVSVREVMEEFVPCVEKASVVVGHNVDFDIGIIRHALETEGHEDLLKRFDLALRGTPVDCTMNSTVTLCGLLDRRGLPKVPKLSELHVFLFGEQPSETLHDALGDTLVTKRCYEALVRRDPRRTRVVATMSGQKRITSFFASGKNKKKEEK